MAIHRLNRANQIATLRQITTLWSPVAFDDGIAPIVTIRLQHTPSVEGRILGMAVPCEDPKGAPILIVQRVGASVPVYFPAGRLVSVEVEGSWSIS